jgi:hypothetical protein
MRLGEDREYQFHLICQRSKLLVENARLVGAKQYSQPEVDRRPDKALHGARQDLVV